MADRLMTIATFDQPPKARLAQNALEAAGIRVAVSDESLVAMDWLLSNAVGGVKVQVWEEDADRAVSVLEREFGEDGAGLGPVEIDPAELAAEAEAAGTDEEPTRAAAEPGPDQADEPTPPNPDGREEYARRAVFCAVLGWLFAPLGFYTPGLGIVAFPFVFYAVYLFLNAAFGEGALSPRGRLNLLVGGLLLSPFALAFVVLLVALLARLL